MATLNRDIVFNLFAKSQQFERAMGTAAGRLDAFADKYDALGRKMSQLGSMMTRRVTVPLVGAGALLINSASDQAEAYDKARIVFDQYADEVIAWANNAPEAMGMTSAAAVDAASNFQNMFTAQGLAAEEGQDMSKALVQLAADMGSLNNVDPTDMLIKLQAAIAGEVEPLRRFGVDISAATVKAEAYRTGIAEVGEELTEQEKIQARYQIILGQTATAQGNYAATSGELANQTRTVRAQFGELAAELGRELLPYAKEALDWAKDMISRIRDLSPRAKELALKIAGITAVVGPLLVVGGKLVTLFATLAKHPILAAIIAIGAGFVYAYQNSEEFRRVVDDVVQWLSTTAWPIMKDIAQWLGEAFSQAAEWIGRNWRNLYNVIKEVINFMLDQLQRLRNQFQWLRNAANILPGVSLPDLPNVPTLPDAGALFPVADSGVRSLRPGGGLTVNVNVAGSVRSDQDLADFVVGAVDDGFRTGRIGGR